MKAKAKASKRGSGKKAKRPTFDELMSSGRQASSSSLSTTEAVDDYCNSPVACFPYLSLLYHCTLSPAAVYHHVRLFSTFYPLFVFSKACLCARLHVHPTVFPLSQPPCVRPLFPSSPFLGSCHSFISTDCVYTYSR